ncbi:putative uncharacterized protein [Eubacterium sp. CAG:786]|nr:putative uncharacterized protein [Eubacterium sp. CAG:786]
MMEYTNKYWKMIIPIVKKGLVRRFGKEETASLLQKADAIYRDMLNRADDIGKDNPMSSNMYEGLIFFAIWEAADGKISIDDLREITHEVMGFPLMKAVGIFVNANKSGLARLEKKMHKNAEWLEVHPQYKGVSWDFNFDKTKHSEGFYYHFTRCPLNDFARREGYLEVLPVMCEIDLISASLMHAKLIRRQTLASGGEMCDYWFVGDKSPSAK